jgi:hypothetical protein
MGVILPVASSSIDFSRHVYPHRGHTRIPMKRIGIHFGIEIAQGLVYRLPRLWLCRLGSKQASPLFATTSLTLQSYILSISNDLRK